MYNDYYPDLILEGLLYDLEYVSESSNNKEGLLTKLKIDQACKDFYKKNRQYT